MPAAPAATKPGTPLATRARRQIVDFSSYKISVGGFMSFDICQFISSQVGRGMETSLGASDPVSILNEQAPSHGTSVRL
jgi:hypothetical protein